jgi:hypothetical protein
MLGMKLGNRHDGSKDKVRLGFEIVQRDGSDKLHRGYRSQIRNQLSGVLFFHGSQNYEIAVRKLGYEEILSRILFSGSVFKEFQTIERAFIREVGKGFFLAVLKADQQVRLFDQPYSEVLIDFPGELVSAGSRRDTP